MARTPLGTMDFFFFFFFFFFVLDMVSSSHWGLIIISSSHWGLIIISSSHWGLIMVPGHEANHEENGKFREIFSIFYTIMDEAILMSTHSIQFHDKIRII